MTATMRRATPRRLIIDLSAALIIVGGICIFGNGFPAVAGARVDHLFRLGFTDLIFALIYHLSWRRFAHMAGLNGEVPMSRRRLVLQACKLSLLMSLLLGGYLLTKYPVYSVARSVMVLLPALIVVELIHSAAGDEACVKQNVIILGSGRNAQKAWRCLRLARDRSITFRGFVDDCDPGTLAPDIRARYLGGVGNLGDILSKECIDLMIIAAPLRSCFEMTRNAVSIAESFSLRVLCLQDTLELGHATILRRGAPTFRTLVPDDESYLFRQSLKNVLERLLAVVFLTLGGALLLLTALISWSAGEGALFVTRLRRGRLRRTFPMFLFSVCAEPELVAGPEGQWPVSKHAGLTVEARTAASRWGQVLRQSSLSKLPQFWNVLTGDMSIVGPLAAEIGMADRDDNYRFMRRFSVRPGITGLWRTCGQETASPRDIAECDLFYIDNWSMLLDLQILTMRIVGVAQRLLLLTVECESAQIPDATRDSAG